MTGQRRNLSWEGWVWPNEQALKEDYYFTRRQVEGKALQVE